MKTLPTVKEFMSGKPFSIPSIQNMMIEFAKLHVTAALKEASEKVKMKDINENNKFSIDEDDSHFEYYVVDKDSILDAYPLEKIK